MKNSIWMRLALIILSVSMVLSLAACNPSKEDVTTDKETDQKTEVETPAETEATTEDVEDTTEKIPDESETKPVETTETKPVETTEKKPVETTEKKPAETTEKKPAETTEKPDEPVVELPLNVYLTAEQLAPKVTGAKFSKVELSADKSYVSIYGADQGDAFFSAYSGTEVTGQYLVLKYRYPATNTTINPTRIEAFLSTTGTGAVSGDEMSIPVTVDGEWHVVILDAATTGNRNGIVANEDGTYSFKYVRLDILNDTTPASDCIDVAYFGITDSIEDALELNKDMKTVTFAEKGTSKDHIKTLYTSTGTEYPSIKDEATKFFGAEELAGKAASGTRISKAELSEDKSYVSVYGYGDGKDVDAYFMIMRGNTDVTGQYMVMKYRYPSTNTYKPSNRSLFAGNVYNQPTGDDTSNNFPVVADGEWHMTVFNLAANLKDTVFVANEDGTYTLKYLRLDAADGMSEDNCIQIQYIALVDDVNNLLPVAEGEGLEVVTAKLDGNAAVLYYVATGSTTPPAGDDEDETGTGDEPGTDPVEPEVPVYEVPYHQFCVNSISGTTVGGIHFNEMVVATNIKPNVAGQLVIHAWFAAASGVEKYQYSLDGGHTWIDIGDANVADFNKDDPNDGIVQQISKTESALLGDGYHINGMLNNVVIDLSDLVDEYVTVTVRAILNRGDKVEFLKIMDVFASCIHADGNHTAWVKTENEGEITCTCNTCNEVLTKMCAHDLDNSYAATNDVLTYERTCKVCGNVATVSGINADGNAVLTPDKLLRMIRVEEGALNDTQKEQGLTKTMASTVTAMTDPNYNGMSFIRIDITATATAGESYIHITPGDVQVGKFVAFIYRSNAINANQMFIAKPGEGITGSHQEVTNNSIKASTSGFELGVLDFSAKTNYDATTGISRIRWDMNATVQKGHYIDVACIAFFDSQEAAEAFYQDFVKAYDLNKLFELHVDNLKVNDTAVTMDISGKGSASVVGSVLKQDFTGVTLKTPSSIKITSWCATPNGIKSYNFIVSDGTNVYNEVWNNAPDKRTDIESAVLGRAYATRGGFTANCVNGAAVPGTINLSKYQYKTIDLQIVITTADDKNIVIAEFTNIYVPCTHVSYADRTYVSVAEEGKCKWTCGICGHEATENVTYTSNFDSFNYGTQMGPTRDSDVVHVFDLTDKVITNNKITMGGWCVTPAGNAKAQYRIVSIDGEAVTEPALVDLNAVWNANTTGGITQQGTKRGWTTDCATGACFNGTITFGDEYKGYKVDVEIVITTTYGSTYVIAEATNISIPADAE